MKDNTRDAKNPLRNSNCARRSTGSKDEPCSDQGALSSEDTQNKHWSHDCGHVNAKEMVWADKEGSPEVWVGADGIRLPKAKGPRLQDQILGLDAMLKNREHYK